MSLPSSLTCAETTPCGLTAELSLLFMLTSHAFGWDVFAIIA